VEAARRIAGIVAAIVGVTLLGAVIASLALDIGLERAISTGLYLVGSFFLVLGFFAGVRGPVRPRSTEEERGDSGQVFGVGIAGRGARTATSEERKDARGTSWLFIFLGAALILAGIIVDSRATLA
jgi:hypothetical protein